MKHGSVVPLLLGLLVCAVTAVVGALFFEDPVQRGLVIALGVVAALVVHRLAADWKNPAG